MPDYKKVCSCSGPHSMSNIGSIQTVMRAADLQGGSSAHGSTPLQALVEIDRYWVQPGARDIPCHTLPSALMLTFEGQAPLASCMAAHVRDVSASLGCDQA